MIFCRHLSVILFSFVFFFSQQASPVVILLNGTSSAGKSSIAHELTQQLREAVEIVSFDQVFFDTAVSMVRKRGYAVENVSCLCELTEKMLLERPDDKDLPSQEVIVAEAFLEMEKRIRFLAAQGKHVIVDALTESAEDAAMQAGWISGIQVLHVLVYCSPMCLVDHVDKRNSSGCSCDYRTLCQCLTQFFAMYKKSAAEECSIDELNAGELEQVLDKAKEEVRADVDATEDEKREFEVNVQKLIHEDLCLKECDVLKIVPAGFVKADIIFNTGISSPQECAQKIFEKFPKASLYF